MTRIRRSCLRGLAVATVLASLAPSKAQAQELPAVLGGAAGLLGGFAVTTGIFVTEARAGHFVYSTDDLTTLRWEYLPVPLGIVGGAWAGAHDADLLQSMALGGGLGLGGGVLVGWFLGRTIWEGEEGKWAGAVIGGSFGLLLGSVLGGLAYEEEVPAGADRLEFAFRIGMGR